MMKRSEAAAILPIATAENFVEIEFEEKFVYYAQRYGLAGKELERGRKMTEEDFRMPDENKMITCKVERCEERKDEETGELVLVPVISEERKRYVDAFPERYKAEVSRAMRIMSKYETDKQELCNDLLLHLDKTLRAAVTQHSNYKDAKEQDDIIKLWEIVVECATGRGAHSAYVSMMRFINLKQKSDNLVGFTEYVKKYNETVTDLMRVGDRDPAKVLRWLFNAKFVQGLHPEQFRDHIKNIMGKEQWPDYEVLQAQLKRYVTASKGIAETITPDNPEGIIIADAANTTSKNRFSGECYNCGKRNAGHRARDCPTKAHECKSCGKMGHLEKFCRAREEDSRTDKRPEGSKGKTTTTRTANNSNSKQAEKVHARCTGVTDDDESYSGEDDDCTDDMMYLRRGVVTIENENEGDTPVIRCYMARDTTDDELFAIDSCCIGHGHLVKKEELLTTTRQGSVTIQGYDGATTKVNTVGHVNGIGKAVLVKDAPNNLINLRKLCGEIGGRYEGNADSMTIYDENNAVYAVAKDYGDGFLSLKYGDVRKYGQLVKAHVATVGQRADMEHFSAEEITRAKDAYELCALLGHPGHKAICRSLDNGNYTHCHLTSDDMRNALKLYGKCAGCVEGKIKAPKALTSKTPPAQHIGDNILVDIRSFSERAIGGYMGELFAVDEKSSYCMVVGLHSKTDITKAAEIVMSHYNANRHRVRHFTMDDERVFESRLKPLEKYGITSSATPAGLKNKRAERYVQTLKDRERSMRATLPYELPANLSFELSMAAAKGMNITSNRVSGTRTPHEIFYGTKHMIPKYVFGQPGVAYKSGDKECRGQWGIFLGNRDDKHHNNIRVYIPESGCVVSRMRFDPVDMVPTEWGFTPRLKQKVNSDGTRALPSTLPIPRKEFTTVSRESMHDALEQNNIIQTGQSPPQPPQHEVISGSSGRPSPQDQEGDVNVKEVQERRDKEGECTSPRMDDDHAAMVDNSTEIQEHKDKEGEMRAPRNDDRVELYNSTNKIGDRAETDAHKTIEESRVEQRNDDNADMNSAERHAEETRRRPRRKATQLTWRDGSAMNRSHYNRVEVTADAWEKEKRQFLRVYRTSLAQALRDDDKIDKRMEAAEAEITNLYVTQKCLKAVKKDHIPKHHLSKIINGHMFFKDKYRADGSYDQCKGRIVVNGNEEDPRAIELTRAPTVNPISLKVTLAKSAGDVEYTNDAYDVVGAFVCTEMPEGKIVIMRVRKQLADIFIRCYPELEAYLDDYGNLHFYLLKFLYGLAEAARGFNGKLHKILNSIGYERSESDECLYLKRTKGGKLHHLCVHVDDIYSAAPGEEARREFESLFGKHFKYKKQYDTVSYLGMMIRKNKKSGEITIDQHGYINELLEKYDVNERAVKSPARPNLLSEAEEKEYLEHRREYVSIVMALMYVARLTRADILMPVTYLATKCSEPTVEDYCNARWVLRYLKGTRNKVLVFKKSDMSLEFHADASYLLHGDGKGHTGFLATIGGNLIVARSGKQKIQARSSTEAEIISVEECATYVVYLRHLCKELDIPIDGPTVVGQDNKSTITIVEQGGTFKRTKHLIGRMSYLRECIDDGVLTLKYVPTRYMKADMLTKPVPKDVITRHMEGVGIVG